jgi:ABC-type microcin C transport system permease subunit YejB
LVSCWQFSEISFLQLPPYILHYGKFWKLVYREPNANTLLWPAGLATGSMAILFYTTPLLNSIMNIYGSFHLEHSLLLAQLSPVIFAVLYIANLHDCLAAIANLLLGAILYCLFSIFLNRLL